MTCTCSASTPIKQTPRDHTWDALDEFRTIIDKEGALTEDFHRALKAHAEAGWCAIPSVYIGIDFDLVQAVMTQSDCTYTEAVRYVRDKLREAAERECDNLRTGFGLRAKNDKT